MSNALNLVPGRGAPAGRSAGQIDRVAARVAAGETVKAACAAVGVTVPTFYRWRAELDRGAESRPGESRAAILDAARKLFLREGYGVSMNRVAEAACVARQTLFNRFGSKERLFREVVHGSFERMMQSLLSIQPGHDLPTTLALYARQYLKMAFDPEGIALHRLTIAELANFPDLAMLVQSLGFSRAVPVLAHYLDERVAAGEIPACDTELAAECFLSAATGHSRHRAIMGTEIDSAARIEARLQASVIIFARALTLQAAEPVPS